MASYIRWRKIFGWRTICGWFHLFFGSRLLPSTYRCWCLPWIGATYLCLQHAQHTYTHAFHILNLKQHSFSCKIQNQSTIFKVWHFAGDGFAISCSANFFVVAGLVAWCDLSKCGLLRAARPKLDQCGHYISQIVTSGYRFVVSSIANLFVPFFPFMYIKNPFSPALWGMVSFQHHEWILGHPGSGCHWLCKLCHPVHLLFGWRRYPKYRWSC